MLTIAPLLLEAESYLVQFDLDRAAALYQRAAELDPHSPLPLIGMARVALAVGDAPRGLGLLDAVLARFPQSVEALTVRAVALETRGEVEPAIALLERARAAAPSYGPAAYNLGRLLGLKHRWAEATVHLQRASELLPEVPEVAVLYGTAAFRAGRLAESIFALRRCIETSPYFVGGYLTLADVLVEAGELGLADELLASVEARFSRLAVFPSKRAAIAMRRGDVDQALRYARRQTKLAPDLDEGWLLVAVLELQKLNVNAAEAAVHEVLRRHPKNWRAHYQLGGIYEALKLLDLAQHAYRNATTLAPDEWRPKNNLATLLLEHTELASTQQARELLESATVLAPAGEQFVPRFNLALACFKLGERGPSEQHAREVVRTAPPSHELHEQASRFLQSFAQANLGGVGVPYSARNWSSRA